MNIHSPDWRSAWMTKSQYWSARESLVPKNAASPFSVTADDVKRLFSSTSAIEELCAEDVIATSPNIQQKGATRVIERAFAIELGQAPAP